MRHFAFQPLSFLGRSRDYFLAWLSSPHGFRRSVGALWQNVKARSARVPWFVKLFLFITAGSVLRALVGLYPVASAMILCLFLGIVIGIVYTFFMMRD